ncbi:MAG TPA: Hsp20/alpha crystallin family protein [Candidatus Acidoferrum sp.]|nr:Hsp20/alpha crystallin family protein [Candidatus Acidoferrum sp.]
MRLVQYERPALAGFGLGRLTTLQDQLEQLFDAQNAWVPALDVAEDKDGFRVRLEVPGLKREDIDVALNDGALVISGERKGEAAEEGTTVHLQERYYGKFSRTLNLPAAVATDKVKAAYRDGVLTVTLPKAEEAKPKTITVGE